MQTARNGTSAASRSAKRSTPRYLTSYSDHDGLERFVLDVRLPGIQTAEQCYVSISGSSLLLTACDVYQLTVALADDVEPVIAHLSLSNGVLKVMLPVTSGSPRPEPDSDEEAESAYSAPTNGSSANERADLGTQGGAAAPASTVAAAAAAEPSPSSLRAAPSVARALTLPLPGSRPIPRSNAMPAQQNETAARVAAPPRAGSRPIPYTNATPAQHSNPAARAAAPQQAGTRSMPHTAAAPAQHSDPAAKAAGAPQAGSRPIPRSGAVPAQHSDPAARATAAQHARTMAQSTQGILQKQADALRKRHEVMSTLNIELAVRTRMFAKCYL